jgi:general secretion pathway protein K
MKRQGGFVLPLTLWILAAIAIAAGAFAERMMAALNLAHLAEQRIQSLIDMDNTRAEILFRLSVTPLTVFGLGSAPGQAIALDDRPYHGEGRSLLRLQDNRSLLNLNFADEDSLHRLLAALNIPFDQRNHLIDTLNDYTDEDGFRRLSGAEAREYEAAGLPPPRNDKLVSPYDLRNILAWRDLPQLWQNSGLSNLTATGTAAGVNPNTAPWEVLITLPGMTEDLTQKIMTLREQTPILSAGEVAGLIGVPTSRLVLQVIAFPSDSIRVTQSVPGQAWALRYNVNLTPFAETAPWRIDYHYKIESPYPDATVESVPQLPKKSTLPANSDTPLLSQ